MSLEDKRFNKGEWAELYVLLKLLGTGKLYAADAFLHKKPDSYLEVLSILREEVAGMVMEYGVVDGIIEILLNGATVAAIPAEEFLLNADVLFDYLLSARGRSVPAPEQTIEFAKKAFIENPKSPSVRGVGNFGGKTDITLRLRDSRTSVVSIMGFSIKSQFGQPPTLFNAGTGSQLLYDMQGMNDETMERFNSLLDERDNRDWAGCVQLVSSEGINPVFIRCKNVTLENNLLYIRESMVDVLAWLYRERLLIDTSVRQLDRLCERMEERNPLGYRIPGLYEKVVKDFLFASFSGMTGSRPWDGSEQVNGGYVVVLPSGEVLCYHANDREQFRDYLLHNTFIEYVSCKKYRWGYVEKDEQNRYVLPLNAAIRFTKVPSKLFAVEYDG